MNQREGFLYLVLFPLIFSTTLLGRYECCLHFVDKIQNFLYMAVYIWLYNLQFISTNTYLSIVKILKRRWGLPSTDETNAQSKQETDFQWG